VQAVSQEGKVTQAGNIMKIFKKFGVTEAEIDQAFTGDIVSIAGLSLATVGATINEIGKTTVIKSIAIDPPMLSVNITYNDSPFQGLESDKSTISQIIQRLNMEADDDVSLKVIQGDERSEIIEVFGRGDLHLGVLLEKMRREGFELGTSLYSQLYSCLSTQSDNEGIKGRTNGTNRKSRN
jgi:GTP-binding protein